MPDAKNNTTSVEEQLKILRQWSEENVENAATRLKDAEERVHRMEQIVELLERTLNRLQRSSIS